MIFLIHRGDSVTNFDLANSFGASEETLRDVRNKASAVIHSNVGLNFRFHPLPLEVTKRTAIFRNLSHIQERFQKQCYEDAIFGRLVHNSPAYLACLRDEG